MGTPHPSPAMLLLTHLMQAPTSCQLCLHPNQRDLPSEGVSQGHPTGRAKTWHFWCPRPGIQSVPRKCG